MRKLFLPLVLVLSAGFFAGCSDDAADPSAVQPAQGLLVVNQGNFGQGNGSLSYFSFASGTAETDAYAQANGQAIGGIIESVTEHQDALYIVVNVEDKIVVVDAESLEATGEIKDAGSLTTPRYMAFAEDKAYVSVWGPYTDPDNMDYSLKSSSIAEIDLNTLQITSSIPVPSNPEGLLQVGNKLYVAHTSDSLSVIDTSTKTLITKVKTLTGPSHFVQDAAGKLWVVHSDVWGSGDGYFVQYNQNTLEEEQRITMTGIAPNGKMQKVDDLLYFSTATALYSINLGAAGAPQLVVEQDNIGTFWVDEASGDIYLGLSDSANPGTLLQLDAAGAEQQAVQIGPFPYQILHLN